MLSYVMLVPVLNRAGCQALRRDFYLPVLTTNVLNNLHMQNTELGILFALVLSTELVIDREVIVKYMHYR